MYILASALMFGISGALWRRWLGGWLGGRRFWRIIASPILILPLFLSWPWYFALAAWGLTMLFWLPSHDWTSPRALLKRYGPIGLWWTAAQRWWPNVYFNSFIDGPIAIAELLAGFTFYFLINLLAIL